MQENPQGYHTDKLETVSFYVCITCGTQFSPSVEPPAACPICNDDRQYVGLDGQKWTTLDELRQDHENEFVPMEAGVTGILTKPSFAIGQRAFLIESPGGNVLWDCVTLLDRKTKEFIRERGGLAAIAISHPHYYSAMVDWAEEFHVPVYLHAADRQWVMRRESVSPSSGKARRGRCMRVSRSSGPAGTSKAAPSCIAPHPPKAEGPCSRATSSRWFWIAGGSALCTAIPT